jgi:3-hydroxyisobutyrate dehydrogenase
MQPRETIALLGTGNMGAGMGRNLLGAGFEVRAWNRTAAKAEPLAERGATVAGSPAEAASGAGIVLTMLADGPAVEAAMTGSSGALAALGDGALWVQSSTVGVDDTRRLAELAAQHGVEFVDAPVLGTRQPAEKGELTVLASGPEAARERCQPLFDAIGSRTLWLGEAGAGTRLKLVVNTWIMGLLGALASTIALARALGLDPQQFLDTIEGSAMGSAYARLKGDMMAAGEYPTSFSVTLAEKDVRLALEAAAEHDADLPLLRVIDDLLREAMERGLGGADMAAIHEATRRR